MKRRSRTAAVGAILSLGTASLLSVSIVSAAAASAENNGVGARPAMGWSSWSFVRSHPTAAVIDAQADAMRTSGLAAVGYDYVNVDDFWYQCPDGRGPNVDGNGFWAIDATKFPPGPGGESGIKVVADHVHADGLKFGLYVTPGISSRAVAANAPIPGTPYHARDIATTTGEANYNCGGMVGIDYSKPGAHTFIDAWAKQFASWGVDYLKIDGVGSFDVPDVQAWSNALRHSGRVIHLELSNNLDIAAASTWQRYSNGWRTGGDIECYCGSTSYPLTNWGNVSSRFAQVGAWAPFGGPGAFNDYDSTEVGNGSNDGLTPAERQSQLSLWAMASSPLILGTDLTNLDATDLSYLKNTAVIAVDQDAIDATRVVANGNQQVYAKTERNGNVIVGLFNSNGSAGQTVSVDLAALGITGTAAATDLWTGTSAGTLTGTYSVSLGAGAVQLLRLVPSAHAGFTTYQAESSTTTLAGGAIITGCGGCSGGAKVGWVGNGATLTFNGVNATAAGTYPVTIAYCDGSGGTTGRSATITVNGTTVSTLTFTPTGGFGDVGTTTVNLPLQAGSNTIEFANPTGYAPDFDAVIVPAPTAHSH